MFLLWAKPAIQETNRDSQKPKLWMNAQRPLPAKAVTETEVIQTGMPSLGSYAHAVLAAFYEHSLRIYAVRRRATIPSETQSNSTNCRGEQGITLAKNQLATTSQTKKREPQEPSRPRTTAAISASLGITHLLPDLNPMFVDLNAGMQLPLMIKYCLD